METTTTQTYQQELEKIAGIDERILCAPAALLTASREQGYSIDTTEYATHLDWSAYSKSHGWSRPGLSRMLRDQYGVSNISWWIGATGHEFTLTDLERMRAAGYLRTATELDTLQTIVPRLAPAPDGIFELAAQGYHLVITVEPGFGANTTHHAILLTGYDAEQGTVTVFNPDERTSENTYSVAHISQYLSLNGACTIILRK